MLLRMPFGRCKNRTPPKIIWKQQDSRTSLKYDIWYLHHQGLENSGGKSLVHLNAELIARSLSVQPENFCESVRVEPGRDRILSDEDVD